MKTTNWEKTLKELCMDTLPLNQSGYSAVRDFILNLLKQKEKEVVEETLKWAEKEVGKKCTKNDFIYQHLQKLLKKG